MDMFIALVLDLLALVVVDGLVLTTKALSHRLTLHQVIILVQADTDVLV